MCGGRALWQLHVSKDSSHELQADRREERGEAQQGGLRAVPSTGHAWKGIERFWDVLSP